MLQGIIGRKLGMTQVFRDNGATEAVTAIEAGPCTVIQVRTAAKEGYNAVQLDLVKRSGSSLLSADMSRDWGNLGISENSGWMILKLLKLETELMFL